MEFWTIQSLAQAAQGRWLKAPVNPAAPVAGLSTDSRAILPGQAFIALKGERFDAHNFLPAVAAAGSPLLIVSNPGVSLAGIDAAVLLVEDTVAALARLARAYRDQLASLGVKVIAVGGSNGKTTTRNLIHQVLSARFRGTQSPKSFNNHIGVPLTLLAAKPGDDFVVVEIGTNHPGEIDALARIARPDAAVITSIGMEHLEFFKDLAGVAREEAALLAHVRPAGLVLLPAQEDQRSLLEPYLASLPSQTRWRFFGKDAGQVARSPRGWRFTDSQSLQIDLPLLGRHNVANAMAAIEIARWMNMPDPAIAAALAQVRGVPMRMEAVPLGTPDQPVLVVNDAYNANPDSMRAALLEILRLPPPLPAGRRVVILGDMLELGDASPQTHRELGQFLAQHPPESPGTSPGISPSGGSGGIDLAILVGKLSLFTAEALARAWPGDRYLALPAWDAGLPAKIAQLIRPGDLVLLKASRGMALERILPALKERFAPLPPSPLGRGSG